MVLAATLVAGAGGLALVGTAGSESVDPQFINTYPILQVKKVVTGTATTGFTVTVSCLGPDEVTGQNFVNPNTTLTFTANGTPDTSTNGTWASVGGLWQFQNSGLGSSSCTVTETVAGGATPSYSCTYSPGVNAAGGQAVGCSAAGPSATAPTVTYDVGSQPGQTALVTVTNAFPVVAAVTTGPSSVTVTGSGFPPGTNVVVDIQSTPLVLGTLTADANGAFSAQFDIPCSVGAGSHTVTARAATGQTAATGVTLEGCTARFTG
jgi:hypothetical protein